MRFITGIISLIMIYFMAGCFGPQEAAVSVDPAVSYGAFEDASRKSDASITHDGDWTVVSRMDKGDRVYWFVAPDVNKVSPALFKKTIHLDDKGGKKTVVVSKCEAPKQTCDELMARFKVMSEKYR